jgi:hypothetical protein
LPGKINVKGLRRAAATCRRPELAQLVRSGIVVDAAEGFVEVAGQGAGGGDDVVTGLDLDGAVAAAGADELAD